MSTTTEQTPRAAAQDDYRLASVTHAPIIWLVVGLLLLTFWLIAQIIQVQTSEAFILGNAYTASMIPHISILGQVWDLFSGKMSAGMIEAAGYAWSVQITFFVAALGTERALHSVHVAFNQGERLGEALVTNAKWRNRGAVILLIALTAIDSWADFKFSTNLSWFSSLIFAVAEFAVSFYVGPRGIHLIEAAIVDIWRPRAKK